MRDNTIHANDHHVASRTCTFPLSLVIRFHLGNPLHEIALASHTCTPVPDKPTVLVIV
jgi:hypothetical protein